jgi:hypothetical protein
MPTHQLKTSFSASSQPQAQDQLVQALQDRIRRVETAKRVGAGETISSGCPTIDRLLPEQGYSPGTLVQWLTPGGYGADYLSLLAANNACRTGGALVVLDPWHQFYPPAIAALGFNMGNLIVLRSPEPRRPPCEGSHKESNRNDLYWAVDQALRCSAVGAVWGPIGPIDERWFRRFQLSAESSGCLGLFIQSIQETRQPSWAEVQWIVAGATGAIPQPPQNITPHTHNKNDTPKTARQRCVRLQLTRCRGTQTGQSIVVSIDAITGEVR